jgi:hypothetical protein
VDRRGALVLSLLALALVGCRIPIEFHEAIPASELPRLERELGVRIAGYQSRHPGTATTLTIGGGVEPGESLETALEKTRRATLEWGAHRPFPPVDPQTLVRLREDRDAQIAHLERHGLLIYLIDVDGPIEALRARMHPLVAR